MTGDHLTFPLPDPNATGALAIALAGLLRAGDTVLLSGPVGAGKSHLARAAIRHLLGRYEDVPSPTFTLVQTYDAPMTEVWHADLYRLSDPSEVEELGLTEAFDTAICLVEWPDRLADLRPADALDITLAHADDGATRTARLSWQGGDWAARLTDLSHRFGRGLARAAFLADCGWQDADATPVTGDASTRVYTRLAHGDDTAILMDADPDLDPSTPAFLRITQWLRGQGLSAPAILHHDAPAGFLLLEDLGPETFFDVIANDAAAEEPLYHAATDLLVRLHAADPPPGLATGDTQHWIDGLDPFWNDYLPARGVAISCPDRAGIETNLASLLTQTQDPGHVTILRDFHAQNLVWLPDRQSTARVGLLDYQDALTGPRCYDLASLLHDARRDVSPDVITSCIARFAHAIATAQATVARDVAILTVQRNLRILGIFQRLAARRNRPGYLALQPRVLRDIRSALNHPALAPLAARLNPVLPDA